MGGLKMRKGIVAVAFAIAWVSVAAPPSVAQTAPSKPLTPQQQKLRDCGAEWQKMKQEGRTNRLTWAELRRECLRRK
jgi:hypothetical protein